MDSRFPPGGRASSPTHPVLLPVITAFVCVIIALINAGWITLIFGLVYLAVCLGHVFIHWVAQERALGAARWAMTSNAALLLTFLLLPDTGDGSGWIAFQVVLGGALKGSSAAQPPWWLPDWSFVVAFGAYLGATGMWLFRGGRRAGEVPPTLHDRT
jgi:hypothetical protein